MKIADARYLTDQLIDSVFTINGKDYCLRKLGWKFKWMNRKKTLGMCKPHQKEILLSEDYVYHNDVDLIKDTILHELAHAFDWVIYRNAGHGQTWKYICVQIGAKPQRCKGEEDGVKIQYKYVLRHKETHEVFGGYMKWPTKTYETLSRRWIRGRKFETYGRLEIVPAPKTL